MELNWGIVLNITITIGVIVIVGWIGFIIFQSQAAQLAAANLTNNITTLLI